MEEKRLENKIQQNQIIEKKIKSEEPSQPTLLKKSNSERTQTPLPQKATTDREKKIAQVQSDKNINREEAKKEVAKDSIQEATGKSALQAAIETREILEVYDALKTNNPNKISSEKKDTDLKTVKSYQEKMAKNEHLSSDLVKAGLGSEQLDVTNDKLEERVNEVADEMENNPNQENKNNAEKTEKSNLNQNILLPPPQIPQITIPPQKTGLLKTLKHASEAGKNSLDSVNSQNSEWAKTSLLQTAKTAIAGVQNIESTIANGAGNIAGNLAEKGAVKILGQNKVGEISGKITKKVTKQVVSKAILANMGGLGK